MRATRTARDPRFVAAAVMIVACALISGMNLGSNSTSAATGPKYVRGFVWDMGWNPVQGANVTVESVNGAVVVKTLYVDATDSIGYYSVTFDPSSWDIGYTLRVTARYDIHSVVNSTTAVEWPYQWVNASLSFEIPEFGNSIVAGLTISGFAAMIIVMISRRRRGA